MILHLGLGGAVLYNDVDGGSEEVAVKSQDVACSHAHVLCVLDCLY